MTIDYIKKTLSLSFSLAKTQFKLRNEGSYLGIFWYLLDPLAMFLIIFLLSGVLANTDDIKNYPIYLLLGLIMFNFFRQTTINSTNSIVTNAAFIKSMRISSESFVVSSAILSFFSHLFELVILLFFMIFFKISLIGFFLYPTVFLFLFLFSLVLLFFMIFFKISLIGFFLYPTVFLFLFLFSLGASFILASIGVYVNDINNVWSVLINLLWFSTPIFYVISFGSASVINKLNPLFYFVNIAREMVISGSILSIGQVVLTAVLSSVFFLSGLFIFEKSKTKFAELL